MAPKDVSADKNHLCPSHLLQNDGGIVCEIIRLHQVAFLHPHMISTHKMLKTFRNMHNGVLQIICLFISSSQQLTTNKNHLYLEKHVVNWLIEKRLVLIYYYFWHSISTSKITKITQNKSTVFSHALWIELSVIPRYDSCLSHHRVIIPPLLIIGNLLEKCEKEYMIPISTCACACL